MQDTRKIVKIFLASPGDLDEERLLVKAVVDEFNDNWADNLGYQVDLVRWEDGVAGYGRPQALINPDLDKCEYFIGLMWKYWGSEPNKDDKTYTSGFDEEFQRSIKRRRETGKPEICMFFKDIEEDRLSDAGPSLEKVLEFRKSFIDGKEVKIDTFSKSVELRVKIARQIIRYIQMLKSENDIQIANQPKSIDNHSLGVAEATGSDTQKTAKEKNENVPFSPEGLDFLAHFIEKSKLEEQERKFTSTEVARFRLLGTVIGVSGNDETYLNAHDANLIFMERDAIDLGFKENLGLFKAGAENFKSENVPVWRWAVNDAVDLSDTLAFYSMLLSQKGQANVLSMMRMLAQVIPAQFLFDRDEVLDSWFSETNSNSTRVAALEYLGDCGLASDADLVQKQLDGADYQMRTAVHETLIKIALKNGRENALETLIELQPEKISVKLLARIFEHPGAIEIKFLKQGIGHRNSGVRRRSAAALREKGLLNADELHHLLSDDDAEVRFHALIFLQDDGEIFSLNEIRNILDKTPGGIGGIFGKKKDKEGIEFFNKFELRQLNSYKVSLLEKLVETTPSFFINAYFVLANKRWAQFQMEVRSFVDDHFDEQYKAYQANVVEIHGAESTLAKSVLKSEELLRKSASRKAMDLICNKGKAEDLIRVRHALRSGFYDYSSADVSYLEKWGEWNDIPLLVDALNRFSSTERNTLLILAEDHSESYAETAKAIIKLGKNRLDEILKLKMPNELAVSIILHSSIAAFQKLSDENIIDFLHSENDKLRKVLALKSINALSKARIGRLLNQYIDHSNNSYYNVLHWLDLGVSLPRDVARRAAVNILEEL